MSIIEDLISEFGTATHHDCNNCNCYDPDYKAGFDQLPCGKYRCAIAYRQSQLEEAERYWDGE